MTSLQNSRRSPVRSERVVGAAQASLSSFFSVRFGHELNTYNLWVMLFKFYCHNEATQGMKIRQFFLLFHWRSGFLDTAFSYHKMITVDNLHSATCVHQENSQTKSGTLISHSTPPTQRLSYLNSFKFNGSSNNCREMRLHSSSHASQCEKSVERPPGERWFAKSLWSCPPPLQRQRNSPQEQGVTEKFWLGGGGQALCAFLGRYFQRLQILVSSLPAPLGFSHLHNSISLRFSAYAVEGLSRLLSCGWGWVWASAQHTPGQPC